MALWAGSAWPACLPGSLPPRLRSSRGSSLWTRAKPGLRLLLARRSCRNWIVFAGLSLVLPLVVACSTGSSSAVNNFCLLYQQIPPLGPSASTAGISISKEALRAIGDNEVAYMTLCEG